jgi:hypothetical protein
VTLAESDVVWNVVWTKSVFTYLRLFVASQIDRSEARFRFIANGCPPEQVALMEQLAEGSPDRIVDVTVASVDDMIAHGVSLDRVRARTDDGPLFCLIDPDIKANAPYVGDLLALLDDHDAVTSGTEVWSDDNVVPVGHPGVAGEFFFDQQGFVFGSPHLAVYRRDALDETCDRWGVGLGSAGPELRDDTKARMASMGHEYLVYDTCKITNALLQGDGHPLVHRDLPQLVHIGGLAHYLGPPEYRTTETGEVEPDWTRYEIMGDRHEVTRYTARTLRHLLDGEPEPPLPEGLSPRMLTKLELVRDEVVDLVERYGVADPAVPGAWYRSRS